MTTADDQHARYWPTPDAYATHLAQHPDLPQQSTTPSTTNESGDK